MRVSVLTAGAALLLCSSAAMAQNTTPSHSTSPAAMPQATTPAAPQADNSPPANNAQAANTGAKAGALRGDVRNMLEQAGFTDIRIMPSSFMVRAKDRSGNPVIMSVGPDSLTEVAEVGAQTGSAQGGNVQTGNEQANPPPPSGTADFVAVGKSDDLSSNLVGLDVYNNAKQDIGQIKDIAMGPQGRARAYIVSVGGFLGVGQRYVAVNPTDIKVSYNNSDKKWHATMSVSASALKSAPQFQYNGRWNATKS